MTDTQTRAMSDPAFLSHLSERLINLAVKLAPRGSRSQQDAIDVGAPFLQAGSAVLLQSMPIDDVVGFLHAFADELKKAAARPTGPAN